MSWIRVLNSVLMGSVVQFLTLMAQWRSGNAGVCKTSMRGFDSLLRLHKSQFSISRSDENYWLYAQVV